MNTELVRYSRAGDEFHYRWAARRCLKMIYPRSGIERLVIEGSGPDEKILEGEYVIDVAEYSSSLDSQNRRINYFQLKHTTVNKEEPFTLSDLQTTFEGFAQRYKDQVLSNNQYGNVEINFTIITNRLISEDLKNDIDILIKNINAHKKNGKENRFLSTIEKYTNLQDDNLINFCTSLEFDDSQGDYNIQREELRKELSLLLSGMVDDPKISNIIELVKSRVMPDSDGIIIREHVLQRLGVTSERDIFPNPSEFEIIDNVIKREQYDSLLAEILVSPKSIIIHASGGVGKSVVMYQLTKSLPNRSLGIIYDCFGGGKYRNRSETRHRHRDALIQIANEIASYGLCTPLIADSPLEDQIMRQFLSRIKEAASKLMEIDNNSILAIFIDAADNAEMAAKEFNQPCFVHELLRETLPRNCRLIMSCRTERIELLQPTQYTTQILLQPFTINETRFHLKQHSPYATEEDVLEFHRLTNGNPRVQANALIMDGRTINQVLTQLGPSGRTVDSQIESQLEIAIFAVKDKFPVEYQSAIDDICTGLATLPPLIPINVLAKIANVNENVIKSFVSDLGRPLWCSDTSIQFRDEPTETWFRERFSANHTQISSYITRIKDLSNTYAYVAEILPSLLLQAKEYDELILLALSNNYLPENPISKRNIQNYRLQFAFKAALYRKRFYDAIKLSLYAGEEVAGSKRQFEILVKNVDLITPLQDIQRVQELAFRRLLKTDWQGSENIYSASLLSSTSEFKGEARGYLRAASNWLKIYFEETKKNKIIKGNLGNNEILELLFTYYNLYGVDTAIKFLFRWKPSYMVYNIAKLFIRRLIDAGNMNDVNRFLALGIRNTYFCVVVVHELLEIGRIPDNKLLETGLVLLTNRRTRIKISTRSWNDTSIISDLISFAEACASAELEKRQILRFLRYYFPTRAPQNISHFTQDMERDVYLRATALNAVLSTNIQPPIDELLPEEWNKDRSKYSNQSNFRDFTETIGSLIGWYMIRARLLVHKVDDMFNELSSATQSSKQARLNRWQDPDPLDQHLSHILIKILTLYQDTDIDNINRFFVDYLQENKTIKIDDRLNLVRIANRSSHLEEIRVIVETTVYELVSSSQNDHPDIVSGWYIDLARAVLPISHDDAAEYFNYAMESGSRFGDEIVDRWESVAAIAEKASEGNIRSPEMAYRFIRCAELIGDNVVREKYFNRNRAIQIMTQLCPASAFAAFSRWQDRGVGDFDRQLPALAFAIVNSKALPPLVAWSLSAFFNHYNLDDFAILCLSSESLVSNQHFILKMAISDLRLNEESKSSWKKSKKLQKIKV